MIKECIKGRLGCAIVAVCLTGILIFVPEDTDKVEPCNPSTSSECRVVVLDELSAHLPVASMDRLMVGYTYNLFGGDGYRTYYNKVCMEDENGLYFSGGGRRVSAEDAIKRWDIFPTNGRDIKYINRGT